MEAIRGCVDEDVDEELEAIGALLVGLVATWDLDNARPHLVRPNLAPKVLSVLRIAFL